MLGKTFPESANDKLGSFLPTYKLYLIKSSVKEVPEIPFISLLTFTLYGLSFLKSPFIISLFKKGIIVISPSKPSTSTNFLKSWFLSSSSENNTTISPDILNFAAFT